MEWEFCGLFDDKLHFYADCVKANNTIRILWSNPLLASDLLPFLYVHIGGKKHIMCHKIKYIWNSLHSTFFTEEHDSVACNKTTNAKSVNFDWG